MYILFTGDNQFKCQSICKDTMINSRQTNIVKIGVAIEEDFREGFKHIECFSHKNSSSYLYN